MPAALRLPPAPTPSFCPSTKKTETPGLWLRLVESFGATCSFGEVRLSEPALRDKFGISADSLPRVVAVVGEKNAAHENDVVLQYEGPTDFERLSEFIRDTGSSGLAGIGLRKEIEDYKREVKALRVELEREREAVKTAQAEVARSKLGQVGQVEAVKKSLETELQDAREHERAAKETLQAESERMEKLIAYLEVQRDQLAAQVTAYEDVQAERVLMLKATNIDVFLASTTRPLKAVLFTTKSDTPPLWSQLAEAQAMTTAFGVIKHTEQDLMERFELDNSDLPRICIWSSEKDEPVVYDGEVKLDALSSFLKDAVHGGDTVIAMRQQVHNAVRQVEQLEAELKRVTEETAAKDEESARARAEQEAATEALVVRLRSDAESAAQAAQAELSRVSQGAKARLMEAEDVIQTLQKELLSERAHFARELENAQQQASSDLTREREAWAHSRDGERILVEELQALEKKARQVDRAVGRAASAVQVTLVREDSELELRADDINIFVLDDGVESMQRDREQSEWSLTGTWRTCR